MGGIIAVEVVRRGRRERISRTEQRSARKRNEEKSVTDYTECTKGVASFSRSVAFFPCIPCNPWLNRKEPLEVAAEDGGPVGDADAEGVHDPLLLFVDALLPAAGEEGRVGPEQEA